MCEVGIKQDDITSEHLKMTIALGMVNLHKFGIILKLKKFSFKIYQKLKIDIPVEMRPFDVTVHICIFSVQCV